MFTNDYDESGLFSKIGQATMNKFTSLRYKEKLLQGLQSSIELPKFNRVKLEFAKKPVDRKFFKKKEVSE